MDELERALVAVLDATGLELVDLEVHSCLLRVTVDREGGVDLEALSAANRRISRALDDLDPIAGRYTLEVSSPGVERSLRRPEHFHRTVGSKVTVRTAPGVSEMRRITGDLVAADRGGFTLEGPEVPGGSQRFGYGEVERARTVFAWGPSPPRSGGKRGSRVPSNAMKRSDEVAPERDSDPRPQGEEVTTR